MISSSGCCHRGCDGTSLESSARWFSFHGMCLRWDPLWASHKKGAVPHHFLYRILIDCIYADDWNPFGFNWICRKERKAAYVFASHANSASPQKELRSKYLYRLRCLYPCTNTISYFNLYAVTCIADAHVNLYLVTSFTKNTSYESHLNLSLTEIF